MVVVILVVVVLVVVVLVGRRGEGIPRYSERFEEGGKKERGKKGTWQGMRPTWIWRCSRAGYGRGMGINKGAQGKARTGEGKERMEEGRGMKGREKYSRSTAQASVCLFVLGLGFTRHSEV